MGFYLLKGRRQAVQTAAQLVDFASLPPARKLAADLARIGIASKQQTSFKYRLFTDNIN
jgi:hypothetical protein